MSESFPYLVGLFKTIACGIAATLCIGPLVIWLAKRVGLLDIPGAAIHKQHRQPTPLAGGITLIACAVILFTLLGLWTMPFSALFAAAAIVFAFGIWDDAKGLSAPQKLLGQIIASILLISSGASVKFLENFSIPFLSSGIVSVLNWILTILWLVGISNSINLIDSMDGLAVGIAEISFGFFMIMALVAQQTTLATFSAIFLGICIGLYFFNITPARLFLGDSGAQTIGFILAAVAMIYTPQNMPQGSSWFVPIMVLGVPIFDTTLVVISRIRRHKPIFQADRSHTYHRLVALGVAPNRAVLTIHMSVLILDLLAFIALSLLPWLANLIFMFAVLLGIIALIIFESKFTLE